MNLANLTVVAFTHKTVFLNDLGKLVVAPDEQLLRLKALREASNHVSEIFYLATCNRVCFVMVGNQVMDNKNLFEVLHAFYPPYSQEQLRSLVDFAQIFRGKDAVSHLLQVASSMDSMVLGEREIARQLRQAYEQCRDWGFTGDFLRLLMRVVVKAAKEVFTETRIAEKPISVASLAVRKLTEANLNTHAKILVVGAGETNTLVTKYLVKMGFKNFTVFNRTVSKAIALAKEIKGDAKPLSDLGSFNQSFDALITCTGATTPIINKELWTQLSTKATANLQIVDLALPNDVDQEVITELGNRYISIAGLKNEVDANLAFRSHEMQHANQIIEKNLAEYLEMLRIRNVELAMSDFPKQVKAIRTKTTTEVFSKEYALLDDKTKSLVDKMLGYMEKKCISVPMKIAKENLVDNQALV